MADLKVGTTVGGSSIWTQSNFPLFPAGNSLLYRDFTLYSTNDKPQASDNDFVSKAQGGIYLGAITLKNSNSTAQMLNIQGSAAGLMLSIANADGSLTNSNYQMYAQGDLLRFRGPNGVDAGLIDIFQWNNATGAKQFEVRGSIKVLTGGRIFDSAGGVVYSPQNKPTPTDVGALSLTGGTVTGEIISTSSGGNNYRLAGTKSVFQRFDDTAWYFMVSDTATGTYNSLRPLSINITTGTVTLANGATISGGDLNVSKNLIVSGNITSPGTITSVGNITTSNTVLASDLRAGVCRLISSKNSSELNFSNDGNGYIQINRANITFLDGGAIPLRTMGPIHVATVNGASMGIQGTHLVWNESGDGRGAIVVNPGSGTGGFNFRFVNNANTAQTGSVTMDAGGTLRASADLVAQNRLYTGGGNSFLAADGNVYGSVYGNDFLTTWVNNNYYPRGSGDGAYARANDAWNKANDAQVNRVQWVRTGGRAYSDYMGNAFRNVEAPSGHVMLGLNANGSTLDATRIIYGRIQVYKDNGGWMDSAT